MYTVVADIANFEVLALIVICLQLVEFTSWWFQCNHIRSSSMSSLLCSASCELAGGSCGSRSATCVAKAKLEETLARYFKFPSFRPGQLEALLPLLHGRDVFVHMATGAGKSLCMFLQPLTVSDSAIGIVISPLNGLMEQQV